MKVNRFDIGSLGAVERMPNGWLRAPGRFTRVGVFLYRNPDGSTRRELRLPEEVFHPDAIKSFAMVPLTNDHPPRMLDSTNTKEYQKGFTGETLVRDGDYLCGPVMVTDAEAISDAEGGKQELSCGYSCDVEETAGTHPQWGKYDAIQRNIRGNHVALVDVGRAGPNARLQLDRLDAAQINETNETERADIMKMVIQGVEYEVSEQVSQAITREREQAKARLDAATEEAASLKKKLDQEKARADTATENLAEEKRLRKDAEDPEKVKARVKARLTLEQSAKKVLGESEKLDGLSEKEIKVKVVQKTYPSADLKDKSDDYLQARFDAALEKLVEDKSDASESTTPRQTVTEVTDAASSNDPYAVREKTLKEESERWKKPLKG